MLRMALLVVSATARVLVVVGVRRVGLRALMGPLLVLGVASAALALLLLGGV
jgi:hypothetical protein